MQDILQVDAFFTLCCFRLLTRKPKENGVNVTENCYMAYVHVHFEGQGKIYSKVPYKICHHQQLLLNEYAIQNIRN